MSRRHRKTVTVSETTVTKRDHPLDPGRVEKQRRRLARLASLGFSAAPCLAHGDGWARYGRVLGPTWAELDTLSGEQRSALRAIADQQVAAGLYIGDLNPHNLIWDGAQWVIVDCGRLRETDAAGVQARLRQKRHWRRLLDSAGW